MPTMIHQLATFTTGDLRNFHGDVVVIPEFDIERGRPSRSKIAGAYLPDPGCPEGKYISVMFHFGRSCWHLETEYSRQKATTYEAGTLPDLLALFESRVGVTLPSIAVFEPGVGKYCAADRYITDNPWKLSNGMVFECDHNIRGTRRFVVIEARHGVEIALLDANGNRMRDSGSDVELESYGIGHLTLDEWKTMRPTEFLPTVQEDEEELSTPPSP